MFLYQHWVYCFRHYIRVSIRPLVAFSLLPFPQYLTLFFPVSLRLFMGGGVDPCEFEASQVCVVSKRFCLKKKKNQKLQQKTILSLTEAWTQSRDKDEGELVSAFLDESVVFLLIRPGECSSLEGFLLPVLDSRSFRSARNYPTNWEGILSLLVFNYFNWKKFEFCGGCTSECRCLRRSRIGIILEMAAMNHLTLGALNRAPAFLKRGMYS